MQYNLRKQYQESSDYKSIPLPNGGEVLYGAEYNAPKCTTPLRRHVVVFLGKQAAKAAFNYSVPATQERLDQIVKQYSDRVNAWAARKLEHKAKAKEARVALKASIQVGQVYHCHWGYSMSINEFYRVKEIRGSKVIVEELATIPDAGTDPHAPWNHPGGGHVVAGGATGRLHVATIGNGILRVQFRYDHEQTGRPSRIDQCSLWDGRPCYENHCD